MSSYSWLVALWALLKFCNGNPLAARAITSTPSSSFTPFTQFTSVITQLFCGGCYGVADLATLVQGQIDTSNALVSVGSTSFTFANGLPAPTSISLSQPLVLDATVTISGLTITSPTGYYVISAFSVTSIITNGTTCSPLYGPPVQTNPSSYLVPSNEPGIALASAENAFAEQLSLSCSGGGAESTEVKISPVATALASSLSPAIGSINETTAIGPGTAAVLASSTSSNPTIAGPRTSSSPSVLPASGAATFSAGAKIGLGVGISLSVIAVAMFGFFLWRRDQRHTHAKKLADDSKPEADSSIYLQGKPELDAQQSRHEAEANTLRREVEAGERHELEVEERRQELKGEDHSQELEVPSR